MCCVFLLNLRCFDEDLFQQFIIQCDCFSRVNLIRKISHFFKLHQLWIGFIQLLDLGTLHKFILLQALLFSYELYNMFWWPWHLKLSFVFHGVKYLINNSLHDRKKKLYKTRVSYLLFNFDFEVCFYLIFFFFWFNWFLSLESMSYKIGLGFLKKCLRSLSLLLFYVRVICKCRK